MIKTAWCAILALTISGAAVRAQTSAPASLTPRKKTVAAVTEPTPPAQTAKREKKEKAKKDDAGKPPGVPGLATPAGPITTEIYADEASFDSAKYIGVFTGHVIVNDPRFNLQSDKLTVFISKEGENGENQGLQKSIAEGNVGLVRETVDPKGGPPTRAIGRADKAIYTTSDGNIEMSGSPKVQQGMNSHVATSADTVMILNQSGQLTTHGPSRTEIRQEPKPPEAAKPAEATKP